MCIGADRDFKYQSINEIFINPNQVGIGIRRRGSIMFKTTLKYYNTKFDWKDILSRELFILLIVI